MPAEITNRSFQAPLLTESGHREVAEELDVALDLGGRWKTATIIRSVFEKLRAQRSAV